MRIILVISSDEALQADLRHAFPRLGLAAIVAPDSRSALKLFSRETPDLAIVCLDLHGGNALETMLEIRLLSPSLPILALAGRDRPGYEKRLRAAIAFGADAALPKPVEPPVLFSAVERLLRTA